MDKASDYESSDSWLKSLQDRKRYCFLTRTYNIDGNFNHLSIIFSIGPVAYCIRRLTLNQKILGLSPSRVEVLACLLYTSPSPRDKRQSRMPSSA